MIDTLSQNIKSHRLLIATLFLCVVLQVFIAVRYPAAMSTDSMAYLAYGDLIVHSFTAGDFEWAKTLTLGAGLENWLDYQWARPDTYRMIGYPAFIALAKALNGENFWPLLRGLQNLFTLSTVVLIYFVTIDVTKKKGWAAISALAYILSPSIFLQNSILTDSLYSSFLAMAFCLAVISFYRCSGFYRRSLLIGIFLGLAFLIREATMEILVVFLPAFLAPIWFTQATKIRKSIMVLLIFLPISTAYIGYGAWNYSRSGHFFMTLNSLHYPLFAKLRQGVPAFSYGEPLDIAAKRVIREFNLLNGAPEDSPPPFIVTETPNFVGRLFEVLSKDFGYNQYDMFVAFTRRNIRLIVDHPISAVNFAFREMLFGNPNGLPPVMGMALAPLAQIALLEQVSLNKSPRSIMSVLKNIRSDNYSAIDVIEFTITILFRMSSLTIFFLYLLAMPIYVIFVRKIETKEIVITASIWVVFIGMSCAYSLAHFEVRYVMAALPSQVICAIICAQLFLNKIPEKFFQKLFRRSLGHTGA